MSTVTIDFLRRKFTVIETFEINSMDFAAKTVFEMYAKNVCQQLEWNNGKAATRMAKDGAEKLLELGTASGVIGAVVLFAICVRTQLDWNNGKYATDVAVEAANLILDREGQNGLPVVQKLFDICINQQLKWGNGNYAKEITDRFAEIVADHCG